MRFILYEVIKLNDYYGDIHTIKHEREDAREGKFTVEYKYRYIGQDKDGKYMYKYDRNLK